MIACTKCNNVHPVNRKVKNINLYSPIHTILDPSLLPRLLVSPVLLYHKAGRVVATEEVADLEGEHGTGVGGGVAGGGVGRVRCQIWGGDHNLYCEEIV